MAATRSRRDAWAKASELAAQVPFTVTAQARRKLIIDLLEALRVAMGA